MLYLNEEKVRIHRKFGKNPKPIIKYIDFGDMYTVVRKGERFRVTIIGKRPFDLLPNHYIVRIDNIVLFQPFRYNDLLLIHKSFLHEDLIYPPV